MARVETTWTWSHWAGTVDQIKGASRLALQRIGEATPFPEDFDPDSEEAYETPDKRSAHSEAVSARGVSITLVEASGFSTHLDDISELGDLTDRETARISSVSVGIGSTWRSPAVQLQFGGHQGFSGRVVGMDRAWTAGVRHELEQILRPDRRLHAPLLGWGPGLTTIWAFTPALLCFSAVALILRSATGWARASTTAIGAGAGSVVYLGLIAASWAAVRFELLQPGERPRYQRMRRHLLAGFGAVCSVIVIPIGLALLGY
jgi:hypothetical protein